MPLRVSSARSADIAGLDGPFLRLGAKEDGLAQLRQALEMFTPMKVLEVAGIQRLMTSSGA